MDEHTVPQDVEARRCWFAEAWRQERAAVARIEAFDHTHPLWAELDAALLKAGGAKLAKRPRTTNGHVSATEAIKVIGQAAFDAIHNPLQERGTALMKEARTALRAARDAMRARAAPDLLRVGEQRRLLRTVWSSMYASQGWGADSYARGSAEMSADQARLYNVPVEVERVEKPSAGFHVYGKLAEPFDVALLENLPGPTLRESVRLCWKRGVNPRVFNPFLPVGYEAQEGLDYHGNDLRAKAGA